MNTVDNWKLSPYIVILYYRNYSCGKFVSNILSFNENFVAQIALTPNVKRYNNIIEKLWDKFDEQLLNDYKIEQMFQTIPPTKEECKNWYEYELGCSMFWGFFSDNLDLNNLHPLSVEILKHNKYCFIAAHDYESWQKLSKLFPNAKTIEVVNDTLIRNLSINLKSDPKYFVMRHKPDNKILDHSFKFDIGSLFNEDVFFQNIKELLLKFNISNRNLDQRVYQFYQSYVELYGN